MKHPGRGLVLLAVLGTLACRPEVVVRLATRVYTDGGLDRRLELAGRTDKGGVPEELDWLGSTAGLRLAEPGAWGRVEEKPGLLRAEGFFPSADALPRLLLYAVEGESRPDRVRTRVASEDRLVVRRWTFDERHGDPFGEEDFAAAVDGLLELTLEAFDHEMRRAFGSDFDTRPAEQVFRGPFRELAVELIRIERALPGPERLERRMAAWVEVLGRHGVAPRPTSADTVDFWELQVPILLGWARREVAAALSTPERPFRPERLGFWPIGEEADARAEAIVERVWGGDEALLARLEPLLAALSGYFGDASSPRFRFEMRVSLPGTLLTTNGTPDDGDVVWLFREPELAAADLELAATSAELLPEPLKRLGARRELDASGLLQLTDLLWERDPEGRLLELLRTAVERGGLGILRDDDQVAETLRPVARELADLLDPDVPLPRAR